MKLADAFPGMGRPVAYYPMLRQITGSTASALLLCQLLYWLGKEHHPKKGIYKSAKEFEEETGLSKEEQMTARKRLRDIGLVKERHARLEHRIYFTVDLHCLRDLVKKHFPSPGSQDSPSPQVGDAPFAKSVLPTSINTEITAQTTAETTSDTTQEPAAQSATPVSNSSELPTAANPNPVFLSEVPHPPVPLAPPPQYKIVAVAGAAKFWREFCAKRYSDMHSMPEFTNKQRGQLSNIVKKCNEIDPDMTDLIFKVLLPNWTSFRHAVGGSGVGGAERPDVGFLLANLQKAVVFVRKRLKKQEAKEQQEKEEAAKKEAAANAEKQAKEQAKAQFPVLFEKDPGAALVALRVFKKLATFEAKGTLMTVEAFAVLPKAVFDKLSHGKWPIWLLDKLASGDDPAHAPTIEQKFKNEIAAHLQPQVVMVA